jgi:hypothetical protein
MHSNDHPRDHCVRQLLKMARESEFNTKRLNHDDRGIGTLIDGYTSVKDLKRMCSWYFDSTGREMGTSLRYRLAFLLCHFNLLRGESARALEFADIFSLELEEEGYSKCDALITIIDHGKTNHNARKEIGACLRNKEVEICPLGGLGFYLFWRFHVEREPFPNLRREPFTLSLTSTTSGHLVSMAPPQLVKCSYKPLGDGSQTRQRDAFTIGGSRYTI